MRVSPRTGLLCLLAALVAVSAGRTQGSEVDPELAGAEQVYRTEGAEPALPVFERLLAGYILADDLRHRAVAERFVGECHWRLGNFDQSGEHLDIAMALSRQLGDRLNEGKTVNVIGLLQWDLGRYELAMSRFQAAAGIGGELDEPRLQGAALNNLSLVLDELGDYHRSLEQYQQVLDIYARVDFPRGEGDTLGNIGGVHLLLGHYSEAVRYYQQALAISQRLGSVAAMSQDQGNLAMAYAGRGEMDRALQHFATALELAEQAGMRQEQGIWLRGMGNAEVRAGRPDRGLEHYRAAIALYNRMGADALLLESLHDMGALLLQLGDPGGAEAHFLQAIALARRTGKARGVSLNQLALGDVQLRSRRTEEASALYLQVLQRTRSSGEEQLHVDALLRMAALERHRRARSAAQAYAEEALQIAGRIGARNDESAALLELGELDRERADVQAALRRYAEAEALQISPGDPDLQWRIEYGRALALVQDGRKREAVGALLRAVRYIEGVRGRLREHRFQSGYLQDKHQVFIDLVRLHLELGEPGAAFSTAERLRAWSYLEQSGPREDPAWTAEQRATGAEMRARLRQLEQVLQDESGLPPADRRQRAIDTFSRELLLAEAEYQAFLDDVQAGADRFAGEGFVLDAERTRQRLAPGEALIEYVVGTRNLMTFVLTRDALRAKAMAAANASLYSRLELLRDLLQRPGDELWTRPAAKLSESLLLPIRVEGWLEGIDHLYLVPHGVLNYLPFAVLPIDSGDAPTPLVADFTLSYLPSAAALLPEPGGYSAFRSMLAVAPGRSGLRHAPEEVASIARLFQPDAAELSGGQATESRFREMAGDYRLLHLATHGYFNKLNPLLSGLELEPDASNDGLLEVHEILGLRLSSDLVTLSACETGLGSGYFNQVPAGDDFVGLTRAFLTAGSAAVLATLWEVDDRSTVDFMQGFYRRLGLARTGREQAEALAAAQRELRKSGSYHHPFYWAPFVLVARQAWTKGRPIQAPRRTS